MFRFAGLGYAVLLTVINRADYSRLDWAWAVIAVMTAWTVGTTMAYARPERRTRLLLTADSRSRPACCCPPRPRSTRRPCSTG